ncbi:MAG: hypothetical protein HY558_03710 [Euryarchaeota archaeon]|nr:hypothetical protein [Euryarchaeota archaeon]
MRHYHTPLDKARYWHDQARRAIRAKEPVLAVEPSHLAVHNAVIALRNFLSHERGRVRHEEVAPLALRYRVPEALAEGVGMVESLKAPYEYGAKVPDPETAARFHRVAEEMMAHLEGVVRSKPPAKR